MEIPEPDLTLPSPQPSFGEMDYLRKRVAAIGGRALRRVCASIPLHYKHQGTTLTWLGKRLAAPPASTGCGIASLVELPAAGPGFRSSKPAIVCMTDDCAHLFPVLAE